MPYFVKNTATAPDPHIWDELKTHSDGLGGGLLDVTELDATKNGGYLIKGAPLYLDFATKVAHVVKSATVLADGTTTSPRVSKNHLFKVGDIGYVSGSAATITAIVTTADAYDVITFDGAVAGATVGNVIVGAGAVSTVAAVKGIYTLTIGTVPAVDDILIVNGISYTFAAAAAAGKIMIGTDKVATAANLQDTVEADNQNFVVKANGATLVFTQKVAGVGAIPTATVTQTGGGTIAASIATTLAGNAGATEGAKYTANCLLSNTTKIIAGVTVTCIYKIDQWVEKARIPHTISALTVSALNPNIILK